ncbi:MAG: hypothetical protein KJ593_06060 [Candidatus Omnitrophica bacterium]|nr:hypothetical protein [Candidatus Omnitrophota bacterium]
MVDSNKKVNFLVVLRSGFRRRFLVLFRPRYVNNSLSMRKGECKKCGRCCLLNKSWCRHFKGGRCQVYERQPFFCKVYPIDPKDKSMSGVAREDCGYYWSEDGKE